MKITDQKLIFAMDFARQMHEGQVRKYTHEPYITHPFAVAGTVSSCAVHVDVITAAFLHDVVEDCGVTLQKLRGIFGPDVAQLVNSVTDVSLPSDGNRFTRKELDRKHLALAHPDAQTIKLADIIDNTKNLAEHDWEFAKVYMNEKKLTLEVLKGGDKTLYNIASGIIESYYDWMEACEDE